MQKQARIATFQVRNTFPIHRQIAQNSPKSRPVALLGRLLQVELPRFTLAHPKDGQEHIARNYL